MTSALAGKRVVVTRRHEQQASFCERLRALGAEPIAFPTIALTPLSSTDLDRAIDEMQAYDWLLFTSANAVHFFFSAYGGRPDRPILPALAVVGSSTGAALAEQGHRTAAMPDTYSGECLAHALGALDGKRVLLPRAKQGRPEIVEALTALGASVDDIPLYDTVMAQPSLEAYAAIEAGVDVLTFTSPLTACNFYKLIDPAQVVSAVVACIGPTTANAVADLGVAVHVVPSEYTIAGLTDALVEYFSERENVHVQS